MADEVLVSATKTSASTSDILPTDSLSQRLALAMQKHAAGDIDGAAAHYRTILADQPDHIDALHLLGVVAQQKGNPALGLKLIEAALAYNANYAAAWTNRALILHVLGRTEDALRSAQLAIENDAHLARAWDMAATLLRHLKRVDNAVVHHQQAVKLEPSSLAFRANFAATRLTCGEIEAAYDLLRDVDEPKEDDKASGEMPPVLGNILQAAGYPLRALRCYRRAAAQAPQMPNAFVNQALAHLKIGDYENGLRLWQTRRDSKDEFFKDIPKWDGVQNIQHLLVYEDQGMGDAIQCLRYLPWLHQNVRQISLQIAMPLCQLIVDNFPDITVTSLDEAVPHADARLSLMSLPLHFKTRLETIPAAGPYLKADRELRKKWLARLSGLPHPKIGLVWGGNPDYPNDKNRSVPFAQLQPLLNLAKNSLVSLQLGRPQDQAACKASGIFDAASYLTSFAETAAALMELDLLITVDTAIAHLAGALGRPVWLLVPFDPDWRWMFEREDSPWYPTIKIFRQTQPGNWATVMPKLIKDIQHFLAGNSDILKPLLWAGDVAHQNSHALDLTQRPIS